MADPVTILEGEPIIRYVVAGKPPVYLSADSEIVIRPGLKADVWSFTTPWSELEKLGTESTQWDVTGKLELGIRPQGGAFTASVTIGNVKFVDAQEQQSARVDTNTEPRPVMYRVLLTDFRWKLAEPRGGFITRPTKINALPFGKDKLGRDVDANGYLPLPNAALMDIFGGAMGVSFYIDAIAADVSSYDLDWSCVHAPTELGRFLERVGYAAVPKLDGTGFDAQRIGQGAEPAVAGAVVLSTGPGGGVDTRPKKVMITSAPTRIANTVTLKGISPDGLQFCGWDPADGQWKAQTDLSWLQGTSPLAAFIDRGKGVGLTRTVNGRTLYMAPFVSMLYTTVWLNPDTFQGRREMLRHVYSALREKRGSVHRCQAKIARYEDELWKFDPAKWVELAPLAIQDEGRVLCFNRPLLKLNTLGSFKVPGSFWELLGLDDLEIEASIAGFRNSSSYYEVGFSVDANGAITRAGDSEGLQSYRNEATIPRPELQLVQIENVNQNLDNLHAAALAVANGALNAGKAAKVKRLSGFQSVSPSGRVSEVRFRQSPPQTTLLIDGYGTAGRIANAGPTRSNAEPRDSGSGAKAQISSGQAGGTQPSVSVLPEPAVASRSSGVVIRLGDPIESQPGRYNATTITGRSLPDATGKLKEADLGEAGAACVAWHLPEIKVEGTKSLLLPGSHYQADIAGETSAGVPIVIFSALPVGVADDGSTSDSLIFGNETDEEPDTRTWSRKADGTPIAERYMSRKPIINTYDGYAYFYFRTRYTDAAGLHVATTAEIREQIALSDIFTNVTVQTSYDIDPTTLEYTKTTRQVGVYAPGDESDEVVITGTECPEPGAP